jgi:hypothetical protein
VRSGLPDAASWWAEPGRAGWQPEAWLGTACPPALAGLALGGWRLAEPARAPQALPWPGVRQVRTPLSGYDSLEVGDGPGAWGGFDGALVTLRGLPLAEEKRARAAFALANGSGGLDENSLTLARGDSLRGVGVDVLSGKHGAESGFERSGRHLWGTSAHLTRGLHRFDASVGQRGTATALAAGEEQAAAGRSGALDWRWQNADTRWSAGFARGLDRHESFGGALAYSERDAQETRLSAAFERARGARGLGARLEWADAEVRRAEAGAFSRTSRSLWGTFGAVAPVAGGRLELALGAGRHGGVDRFEIAPSARFASRVAGWRTTLGVERMLTPVWADLAPGTEPFVQQTWAGALRVARADSGAWRARGALLAGRVHERALVVRQPLEDLWLRAGVRADPAVYDFALAMGGLEWSGRHLGGGFEGFGLAHRSTRLPADRTRAPRADPDAGFRAWLGGRGRLFAGDLGVALRGVVEGVGAREADLAPYRRIPAFVTFGVAAEATLEDVTLVLEARNLEDRPRAQSWLDSATGLPAIAGRRDLRFSLVWRFFN